MNLITACSKSKLDRPGPAKDVYTGQLFVLSKRYAEMFGLSLYILSGKYGLITDETLIIPYEQRMKKSWDGPWPPGSGYWFGPKDYFAKAPPNYVRLFPFVGDQRYGMQKKIMTDAINSRTPFRT